MNFRSLETFIWIARLGSFRAAAERVYTTQPSVSARIAGLENELGVKLFDRVGRNVSLTAKGRDLLVYAERLLSLQGEMLQSVAGNEAIRGSIRLGVSETIVYTWLPRLLERLNEAYPAISLELDVDISINLADKLVNHEVDIAFLMGPVNQPDIANQDLCRYPLVWVASPSIELPPEPVPLASLAQWPIITYPRLSKPYVYIRTMIEQAGNRTRIHSSSSLATIIRMTVDGIGVSALPAEILQQELAQGVLHTFEVEGSVPDLVFTASYGMTPESNVVKAVANLALETAQQHRITQDQ